MARRGQHVGTAEEISEVDLAIGHEVVHGDFQQGHRVLVLDVLQRLQLVDGGLEHVQVDERDWPEAPPFDDHRLFAQHLGGL